MRSWTRLCQRAGLGPIANQLAIVILFAVGVIALVIWQLSSVLVFAVCVACLSLALAIEVIRTLAQGRLRQLQGTWPAVYDSFQSAAQSALGLEEQLEYLWRRGPKMLRRSFHGLLSDLESGQSLAQALSNFRLECGTPEADRLTLLLELSHELGGYDMAQRWSQAAAQLRSRQGLLGQVLAKQGWVIGSAKVAVLSPWLVGLALMQLPQNRLAFASEAGAVVLVLGLSLSLIAYLLVNRIGTIRLPGRVFNAIS